MRADTPPTNREIAKGLGRAFGASLIFSLPMLMTMEMWWLGFYMERIRLCLMIVSLLPLLLFLARHIGFERTSLWKDAARDTAIALGVGIITSLGTLVVFGIINADTTFDTAVGQIVIQLVPTSFGALLGRSQFGKSDAGKEEGGHETRYWSELALMAAGALFLGLNLAPTEEMLLISFRMGPWHGLILVLLSLSLMHGFVYTLSFSGDHARPDDASGPVLLLRFTVVGYMIALGISVYILWLIGRLEGNSFHSTVMASVVLAFPSSLGAAAARLVL